MGFLHDTKSFLGHTFSSVHAGDKKLAARELCVNDEVPLSIRSSAFENGAAIPKRHTQEGENVSPPLAWANTPVGTQELVLICEDPDAPMRHPFVHWILYGLSAKTFAIPDGITAIASPSSLYGATQGVNSAKTMGYTGPMPPIGHGLHHYHFQLFALNNPVDVTDEVTRDELVQAMEGFVIGYGELVGTYERK